MTGMTTVKIAVSLPAEAVKGARRAVKKGQAASVSAYVAAAIKQKAMSDDLEELLAELLEESGGPSTAAERREANRILDGSRTKR